MRITHFKNRLTGKVLRVSRSYGDDRTPYTIKSVKPVCRYEEQFKRKFRLVLQKKTKNL